MYNNIVQNKYGNKMNNSDSEITFLINNIKKFIFSLILD